jgi:hypothetical protein
VVPRVTPARLNNLAMVVSILRKIGSWPAMEVLAHPDCLGHAIVRIIARSPDRNLLNFCLD